jgi:hypothetical protein
MPRSVFRSEHFERAARGTFRAQKVTAAAPVHGSFIRLGAKGSELEGGWVVLAYEVAMARAKVELTKADFEQCVKNFAAYPCCPVTIEHADVMGGPAAWAEPNGHIEELRVGEMTRTVDGAEKTVATLEGRPSYLGTTAADVASGKWRFGSIYILKGVVDEESNTKLGALLWSWSLTAHPRLTGLPALTRVTAARRPEGDATTAGWWYGDIDDRDDLISCLREILDLPVTTTEAEVLAELDKLEALSAPGADTSGIDVDRIVSQLRDALRLPALTTTAGVLAEVRKGLANLPDDDAAETDASLSRRPPAAPPPAPKAPPTPESHPMKLVALLASFGLSVPTEEEAQTRVACVAQLGADAAKALGLPVTTTPTELSAKLSALSADAARVKGLETELATFRSQAAEAVKAEREKHLAELFAVQPALKGAEVALRMHAERDPEGFAKAFPRPSAEQLLASAGHDARTQTIVGQGPTAPATFAQPAGGEGSASVIAALVHSHIAIAASQGRELSFAEALSEIGG